MNAGDTGNTARRPDRIQSPRPLNFNSLRYYFLAVEFDFKSDNLLNYQNEETILRYRISIRSRRDFI